MTPAPITEQTLLHTLGQLKLWSRGEQRAVHKPLLLLLALGHIHRGGPRLTPFTELEPRLLSLLREHAPARTTHSASYPFWRLQHDGLWEVEAERPTELVTRQGNTDPTLTSLRRANARGGFIAGYDQLLRVDPALLRRAARTLLDSYFPSEVHETLRARTLPGLS